MSEASEPWIDAREEHPGYDDLDSPEPKTSPVFRKSRKQRLWKFTVGTFAAGLILVWMGSFFLREDVGIPRHRRAAVAEIKAFNEALQFSRDGKHPAALEKLQAVEKRNPDAPSLDYLFALISLENGDAREASARADASILKGDRVADSLILKSLAESSLASGLRDAGVVRESLLREAISSDPANPFAMAELANVLRDQGRKDEALDLLVAARARLHPVDSHVVVETSIRLLELERLPDDRLPQAVQKGTLPELFASAYILLRLGKSSEAAGILDACRKQSPPSLFEYITGDSIFGKHLSGSQDKAL